MMYNPFGVEEGTTIDRMEVPVPPDDTGTLLGLTDKEGPAGNTECDKDTVFEKPKTLPSVIVTKPD